MPGLHKAWHATLVSDGGNDMRGIFAKFTSFVETTTHFTSYGYKTSNYTTNSYIKSDYTTKDYHLSSFLCFPRKIDYTVTRA